MQVIPVPQAATGQVDQLGSLVGGSGSVVTIGAYDGVHLGHRELIAKVRERADLLDCASGVVTFDRHPATIVRPESAPLLLTDLDQKLELLASTGVDFTVVVRFDTERAREEPEQFVASVLVEGLRVRSVVVGHDFHFGRGREGNVELLAHLGSRAGFEVSGVSLVGSGPDGTPVSSTRIRALLAAGRVEAAAELLGRPHQVRGRVEAGDRRGRELGFPTANVALPGSMAIPAEGVYAGWYIGPGGKRQPAAVSLGRRPTFYREAGLLLLEAHLLDFGGDLYGQRAGIDFVARLRGQERYDTPGDLAGQMRADVAATRRVLRAGSHPAR